MTATVVDGAAMGPLAGSVKRRRRRHAAVPFHPASGPWPIHGPSLSCAIGLGSGWSHGAAVRPRGPSRRRRVRSSRAQFRRGAPPGCSCVSPIGLCTGELLYFWILSLGLGFLLCFFLNPRSSSSVFFRFATESIFPLSDLLTRSALVPLLETIGLARE